MLNKSDEAKAAYELERFAKNELKHTELKWEAISHCVRTVRNEDGSGGFLVCDCGANVPGNSEMAAYIADLHNESLTIKRKADLCDETLKLLKKVELLLSGIELTDYPVSDELDEVRALLSKAGT